MELSDVDRAYLAGIIDGEGSITLSNLNAGQNRAPRLSVDSTDKELLTWIQDRVGGNVVIKKKYQDHHSQAWTWKVEYRAVLRVLAEIVPYMVIVRKINRAQLLLDEYVALTPGNGKYTAELLGRRNEMVERFHAF